MTALVGLADLWMFVYVFDYDIRALMLSIASPDRPLIWIGGQGVYLSEVVFLGSITALVAGVGTLMWLSGTFLNQAVVAKMDGVYQLTENQIGKVWKCGGCGEFFEFGAWMEYGVFGGVDAGKIKRHCLVCKTEIDTKGFEIKKEHEPGAVKEASDIIPIIKKMNESKAEIKEEIKQPDEIQNKSTRKKKGPKPKTSRAIKPVSEVDPKTKTIRVRAEKAEFKKDNVERFS